MKKKIAIDSYKRTGKQIKLVSTPSGVLAVLYNGVIIGINFNQDEVHLHFSRIDLPMKIRENGTELSNYVTIQYKIKEQE